MKLWSPLCLLVLVVSSVCRGQGEQRGTSPPPAGTSRGLPDPATSPTPVKDQEDKDDPRTPQEPPAVLQSNAGAQNETDGTTPPTTSQASTEGGPSLDSTTDGTTILSTVSQNENNDDDSETGNLVTTATTATTAATVTTVTTGSTSAMTTAVSGAPAPAETPGWAYVVMTLIFIAIFILCVILYFLRRASRTYSFDLQRPAPVDRLNEPTGTFELYLDDLESPAPGDHVTSDDLSPPPMTNGTTQLEEKSVKGEKAPLEQPGSNGVDSTFFFPLPGDEAAAERRSEPGDTNLLCEAAEEQPQNENNNNPAVCNDPFVEINLEDPAWCDQLLTSSEAPSSAALPFSPFSFSSSSSSSS